MRFIRNDYMPGLLIVLLVYLFKPHTGSTIDQIPDMLIVGHDTILLKSFPLEDLGFQIRPFMYGNYDFPHEHCYRGYQATWKVIHSKLYLTEVAKVDETREKLDMVPYFHQNGYEPITVDGLIFADWYTKDLTSFPKNYTYWGCVWKSKTKKQKPSMRFENGILRLNKYNSQTRS